MKLTVPSHVRAALEHLSEKFRADPRSPDVDLSWAHRILERHRAGETIAPGTLQMAREAVARRGEL